MNSGIPIIVMMVMRIEHRRMNLFRSVAVLGKDMSTDRPKPVQRNAWTHLRAQIVPFVGVIIVVNTKTNTTTNNTGCAIDFQC